MLLTQLSYKVHFNCAHCMICSNRPLLNDAAHYYWLWSLTSYLFVRLHKVAPYLNRNTVILSSAISLVTFICGIRTVTFVWGYRCQCSNTTTTNRATQKSGHADWYTTLQQLTNTLASRTIQFVGPLIVIVGASIWTWKPCQLIVDQWVWLWNCMVWRWSCHNGGGTGLMMVMSHWWSHMFWTCVNTSGTRGLWVIWGHQIGSNEGHTSNWWTWRDLTLSCNAVLCRTVTLHVIIWFAAPVMWYCWWNEVITSFWLKPKDTMNVQRENDSPTRR